MIIAGVFTAFQQELTSPDASLLSNSLALGNDIFVTLFVTYVIAGLCKCAFAQDFTTFWWGMGSLVYKMIIPLTALNFAHIILPQLHDIIGYFVGRITGSSSFANADDLAIIGLTTAKTMLMNAGAPIHSPGAVLKTLIKHPANLPLAAINLLFAFQASLVLGYSCISVGIEQVLAWYQVLFSASIGAASVGFFGSEATSNMAFRYTSSVVSGVWKVVFMSVWPAAVVGVYNRLNFSSWKRSRGSAPKTVSRICTPLGLGLRRTRRFPATTA